MITTQKRIDLGDSPKPQGDKAGAQARSYGLSFMNCLGLLFIGLKLTGHVSWSWWVVLLPIYGPPAALFSVGMLMFAIVGVMKLIEWAVSK